MSPIATYRGGTSITYDVTYKKLTLDKAFELVVRGQLNAMDVFRQCPKPLQQHIDEASMSAFGRKFDRLCSQEQIDVFQAFLLALKRSAPDPGDHVPSKDRGQAKRRKRWWQFWR